MPEFWLIDSQAKTVEVLKLQGKKYLVDATLAGDQVFTSNLFPAGSCPCMTSSISAVGSSVLSQESAEKVYVIWAAFSQPRQGRKIVAQGASPGVESPHPAFGTPLPVAAARGDGGEGGRADPRLTPWATFFRPDKSGLTYSGRWLACVLRHEVSQLEC